jgi:hypothetical protein
MNRVIKANVEQMTRYKDRSKSRHDEDGLGSLQNGF